MWLTVENVLSTVTRATDEEREWLSHFLAFGDSRKHFITKQSQRIELFNKITDTLPTGMLPVLRAGAKTQGYTLSILDNRVRPVKCDPNADVSWLFDSQDAALEMTVDYERGVYHVPTSGGKTELMAALTNVYPCVWGMFVPSASLLEEIAARIEKRTGNECGRIGDSQWSVKRVTVATYQTVYRGLAARSQRAQKFVESLQAIACDEVHTAPSKTFNHVIVSCANAYYRYGFSGTPFARGDKKGALAVAALGPTIFRIKTTELVTAGVVAKAAIKMLPVQHDGTFPNSYGDMYDNHVVRSAERNALLVSTAAKAKRPVLVFVKLLEHGERLHRALVHAGVLCEFVFGEKSTHQREAAVQRLVNADIDVLIANVIFQAGVNIPELQTVVNGVGGKSAIVALQQAGRGARRIGRDGEVVKDTFTVYDINDKGCGCRHNQQILDEHGELVWRKVYVHKSCEWLERHSKERSKAYIDEGYTVTEL